MTFVPVQPDEEDIKAYARGFFPEIILGNHITWAMNYLNIEGDVPKDDSYPKYRMYLSDACNLYMERLYYE